MEEIAIYEPIITNSRIGYFWGHWLRNDGGSNAIYQLAIFELSNYKANTIAIYFRVCKPWYKGESTFGPLLTTPEIHNSSEYTGRDSLHHLI